VKQVQLSDLVEIRNLMPLRSLSKRYTGEKVSEPFNLIRPQAFNEWGYSRAAEMTSLSLVNLSEHDLRYLSSRDLFLKPLDILIPFRHPSKFRAGIILDEISPSCIASPFFTILRVEDHQLRKELSFNILIFLLSKKCEHIFNDWRLVPSGRKSFLSRILIPLLEGDERKTLVNNVELQIQKCKEIEKIKTEIDQIRVKNGLVMFGNGDKPH
jgi:hypothetical protein